MIAFITETRKGTVIKFSADSWGHARDKATKVAGIKYKYIALDKNTDRDDER